MNFDPVDSSLLDAVAYDETTSTLRVQFKNGTQYEYSGVPIAVYHGLLRATSSGVYFNAHVNEAGYWFRRVG
jgi:hypothetical protein